MSARRPPAEGRLRRLLPDPGRLWVAYAPDPWPARDGLWLDLATGGLGRAREGEVGSFRGAPDDLVYLPPVPPALAAGRDALLRTLRSPAGGGCPILVQVLPGDPLPAGHGISGITGPEATADTAGRPASAGDARPAGEAIAAPAPAPVIVACDLLEALLELRRRGSPPVGEAAGGSPKQGALGEPGSLSGRWSEIPAGCVALWPLLPGIGDDPALWRELLPRLAKAGVAALHPVLPSLSPGERRRLAEAAGEEAFASLFHAPSPRERDLARAAARHGLATLTPRPLPARSPRVTGNRRMAGELALVGELWLRLERGRGRGEAFFRAARWADGSPHDLAALVREGNLAVLPWLDPEARQVLEEVAGGGRSRLLAQLEHAYLSPPAGSDHGRP